VIFLYDRSPNPFKVISLDLNAIRVSSGRLSRPLIERFKFASCYFLWAAARRFLTRSAVRKLLDRRLILVPFQPVARGAHLPRINGVCTYG
jgi:hypothetical protein